MEDRKLYEKTYKEIDADSRKVFDITSELALKNINHLRQFHGYLLNICTIIVGGFLALFFAHPEIIKSIWSAILGIFLLFVDIILIVFTTHSNLTRENINLTKRHKFFIKTFIEAKNLILEYWQKDIPYDDYIKKSQEKYNDFEKEEKKLIEETDKHRNENDEREIEDLKIYLFILGIVFTLISIVI